MSDADDIISAMNRNTQAVKENTDELRRLREEFAKLSAHAPRQKDKVEGLVEGLAPLAVEFLRGGKKRR